MMLKNFLIFLLILLFEKNQIQCQNKRNFQDCSKNDECSSKKCSKKLRCEPVSCRSDKDCLKLGLSDQYCHDIGIFFASECTPKKGFIFLIITIF